MIRDCSFNNSYSWLQSSFALHTKKNWWGSQVGRAWKRSRSLPFLYSNPGEFSSKEIQEYPTAVFAMVYFYLLWLIFLYFHFLSNGIKGVWCLGIIQIILNINNIIFLSTSWAWLNMDNKGVFHFVRTELKQSQS